jgi:hypothetical protein
VVARITEDYDRVSVRIKLSPVKVCFPAFQTGTLPPERHFAAEQKPGAEAASGAQQALSGGIKRVSNAPIPAIRGAIIQPLVSTAVLTFRDGAATRGSSQSGKKRSDFFTHVTVFCGARWSAAGRMAANRWNFRIDGSASQAAI